MYSNQPTWIFIAAILRGISETSQSLFFCHSESKQVLHVGVIKTGSYIQKMYKKWKRDIKLYIRRRNTDRIINLSQGYIYTFYCHRITFWQTETVEIALHQ